MHLLQAEPLTAIPWLRHAFSTRRGGATTAYHHPDDLNLGLTPDDAAEAVLHNRRLLTQAVSPTSALITARQTHSTIALHITHPPPSPPEADALLTATPGLLLAILTADCVPILLADPTHRAVAAIHAGWRGTAANIVQHAIAEMHRLFHSDPTHLIAAIGPAIGQCCYEVGEEVRAAFDHHPGASTLFTGRHLDLKQANRLQLQALGVTRICTLPQCTACTLGHRGTPAFFSHRRDCGHTGRMLSVIAIEGVP